MTPALVVCDLDGTLVRLAVDWVDVRARLALEAGRVGVPAGPVSATLGAIADACPLAGERTHTLVAEAEVAGARRGARNVGLVDRLGGVPVAILTNNSRRAAEAALPRLGLRPRGVVGREDAPPKPDPAGLRALLERCAVPADRALMVGDAAADFAAAAAAGVRAVHVRDLGERWVA